MQTSLACPSSRSSTRLARTQAGLQRSWGRWVGGWGQVEEQGHVGGDWGRVDGAEELADVLGQAGDAAVASSRAQQQW